MTFHQPNPCKMPAHRPPHGGRAYDPARAGSFLVTTGETNFKPVPGLTRDLDLTAKTAQFPNKSQTPIRPGSILISDEKSEVNRGFSLNSPGSNASRTHMKGGQS